MDRTDGEFLRVVQYAMTVGLYTLESLDEPGRLYTAWPSPRWVPVAEAA
jgi:hypothetical protein